MPLIHYTQDAIESAQGRFPTVEGRTGKGARPITIRVFRSGLLEGISKAHPITPIVWSAPLMGYGLYRGVALGLGAWKTAGIFLFGWLLWTLLEYFLHRVVFHLRAETSDEKFRFFMMHGYHHDYANDPMRLVAPPMLAWPITFVVGLAYYFALGPVLWLPTLSGTLAGYVAYDWVHYYTHHFRPTTAIGKWMRKYHMEHHYLDHDAHYGVSSPLWDFVFRTHRARRPTDRTERPAGEPLDASG